MMGYGSFTSARGLYTLMPHRADRRRIILETDGRDSHLEFLDGTALDGPNAESTPHLGFAWPEMLSVPLELLEGTGEVRLCGPSLAPCEPGGCDRWSQIYKTTPKPCVTCCVPP